jgi:molybdenum cofactor cytidylyltransferase
VKVAALLLAAGGSSRLGKPKQLLEFEGETFVRRTVRAASEAGCQPVVVVTGRDHAQIAAALRDLPVELLPNESWEKGIGTSIRLGIRQLSVSDAVVLLVCDQPHVTATHLRQLVSEQTRTKKPMAASAYANTIGVPALFTRDCFPQLLSLGDTEGAKKLLQVSPNDVATVAFAPGAIDIDSLADYAQLIRSQN